MKDSNLSFGIRKKYNEDKYLDPFLKIKLYVQLFFYDYKDFEFYIEILGFKFTGKF